jgi:glycosyltransferase involved in cell wall biosynthesis
MTMKYRFHFLGMPHTTTSPEYCHCAYTSKVYKAIRMFSRRGHTCIDYSNEGSTANCEHVQIFTEAERAAYFGPHDKQKLYHIVWDPALPYWKDYNARLVIELSKRVRKGDFVLTLSGNCQVGPIGDCFPGSYSGIQQTIALVEWGIGYYGWQSRYRVFESHGHREWVMGRADQKGEDNDSCVIPNFFDMDEFPPDPPIPARIQPAISKPYYLFIGRIVQDKGFDIAIEVTRDIGARLVIAGQGNAGDLPGMHPHVTHVGHANVEERAALMTGAIGVFAPTRFREPFGGVAVEAQLCGAPAITTDHGAFCETVEARFRCASHREFCDAAKLAASLSADERRALRVRAEGRYSLDVVGGLYQRYFDRLYSRWDKGWYSTCAPEEIVLSP